MITSASPMIDRARALAKRTFGAVPEVYGDDEEAYARLDAFFRQLR